MPDETTNMLPISSNEQLEIHRTQEPGRWAKIHLSLGEAKPNISRLSAPTFSMRIGSAVVKMGGVAGVGTNESERKQGYARLILDESTRYFTETGHDVAILFGIPDLYHKFGYAPVLPVTTLRLRVEDILLTLPQQASTGYTVRTLEESDWPAVLELYDLNNRTRTGTLLRPREEWNGYRHGTRWTCGTESFVVSGGKEQICGYVAFDAVEDACRVGDLGYQTTAVFAALLNTMVEAAQRRNQEEIEIKLPPDHAFLTFCRRCGGHVETVYERNANGMGRIVNLQSLFEKLAALLSDRLQCSSLIAMRGMLELQTDLGAVSLEMNDGKVSILPNGATSKPTWSIELPQMRLMQLVMGYRCSGDLLIDEGVEIPVHAIPLLDTLFPVGNPWMPTPDWF